MFTSTSFFGVTGGWASNVGKGGPALDDKWAVYTPEADSTQQVPFRPDSLCSNQMAAELQAGLAAEAHLTLCQQQHEAALQRVMTLKAQWCADEAELLCAAGYLADSFVRLHAAHARKAAAQTLKQQQQQQQQQQEEEDEHEQRAEVLPTQKIEQDDTAAQVCALKVNNTLDDNCSHEDYGDDGEEDCVVLLLQSTTQLQGTGTPSNRTDKQVLPAPEVCPHHHEGVSRRASADVVREVQQDQQAVGSAVTSSSSSSTSSSSSSSTSRCSLQLTALPSSHSSSTQGAAACTALPWFVASGRRVQPTSTHEHYDGVLDCGCRQGAMRCRQCMKSLAIRRRLEEMEEDEDYDGIGLIDIEGEEEDEKTSTAAEACHPQGLTINNWEALDRQREVDDFAEQFSTDPIQACVAVILQQAGRPDVTFKPLYRAAVAIMTAGLDDSKPKSQRVVDVSAAIHDLITVWDIAAPSWTWQQVDTFMMRSGTQEVLFYPDLQGAFVTAAAVLAVCEHSMTVEEAAALLDDIEEVIARCEEDPAEVLDALSYLALEYDFAPVA